MHPFVKMESEYVFETVNFNPLPPQLKQVVALEDCITHDIHSMSSMFNIFMPILFEVT